MAENLKLNFNEGNIEYFNEHVRLPRETAWIAVRVTRAGNWIAELECNHTTTTNRDEVSKASLYFELDEFYDYELGMRDLKKSLLRSLKGF